MNKQIQNLLIQAKELVRKDIGYNSNALLPQDLVDEKFAELIVRECADAADMAYDARCKHPGDYVGEQMGYGEEHGITAWRLEK